VIQPESKKEQSRTFQTGIESPLDRPASKRNRRSKARRRARVLRRTQPGD
jgi:hypothetical protein